MEQFFKKMVSRKSLSVVLLTALLLFVFVGCQKATEEAMSSPFVLSPEESDLSVRDAIGTNGSVTSANAYASKVGLRVLEAGGNAIDAAVATGFALGVFEPNASGLGGGGFMLIRLAETGEEIFVDFREMAPLAATAEMYLGSDGEIVKDLNHVGHLSVAVPGEVKGLLYALENYGTMDRAGVMDESIYFAENGFPISEKYATMLTNSFEKLNQFPESAKVFFKDGLPLTAGDIHANKDLAATLKIIRDQGADGFYKGEIAQKIAAEMAANGGIISEEDLAQYEVSLREPVKGVYKGYEILSVSPPSSGGAHVIQMLNMMENYDLGGEISFESAERMHLWAEVMKLMYNDRSSYMADTDFVDVPLIGLTSKEYAKELVAKIDLTMANNNVEMVADPWPYESASTTHFSVVDSQGNIVSVTKTIEQFFGSGVVVPGTGVILNDEMGDFVGKPGSANSIEPRKKPLSSMTPVILSKDSKPVMTLGSPGGPRIITTVALILSNIIDYDMDIQEAINAPRINQYAQGDLKVEDRIPESVLDELREMGHGIDIRGEYDAYFGGAQGITIDSQSGEIHAGADPRRDGKALAY